MADMPAGERDSETSERRAHAEATYERLFGPRDGNAPDNDPELMEIMRRFIFGDVFDTGVLDDKARELITVTVLACLQTLPQLKAHTAAALKVEVQTDRDPRSHLPAGSLHRISAHAQRRRHNQRGVPRPRHRAAAA